MNKRTIVSTGNTVKGEACGLGILCLSDGELYKGEFSKNQRHGKGESIPYIESALPAMQRCTWAGSGLALF
jgi:hypothetical protein